MKRVLLAGLLPLSALAVVAGLLVIVSYYRSNSEPEQQATLVAADGDAAPGAPRLAPESNVCQGILHRPDPGEPRVFDKGYTQKREANGITIVGNSSVDPRAMDEAAATVERLFRNNDLEERLATEGAYVIVAEASQGVLDLPEFRCMDRATNSDFFSHVCGVADRADYPVVTVNEDDLLGNRRGPCAGLNILFHELGHLVQGWTLGPADYIDVRLFYQDALNSGKYRRDYAATNANEYFAEATQAYFLHADVEGRRDRDWLKSYDPQIFKLLDEIYRD